MKRIKFAHTEVFNFEGALRGMRNPLDSWGKTDSGLGCNDQDGEPLLCKSCRYYGDWCKARSSHFIIGKNDLKLINTLINAGTDHSKFMRQILISVDITAPLYWFSEFDTYKVGTAANSTSTMHRLALTPITQDCFEFDSVTEDFGDTGMTVVEAACNLLENYRKEYLRTKDQRVWRALIQLLPRAWLQTRTVTMSYQNVRAMYLARKNHKLREWSHDFVAWVETLPYAEELITIVGE